MRGWRRYWELEPERRSCRGRSSSHPPIRRSWCCLARKPLASSPRGCANMEGRWSPCRRGPAPPTDATTRPGRITAAPWHGVAPSLGFPAELSRARTAFKSAQQHGRRTQGREGVTLQHTVMGGGYSTGIGSRSPSGQELVQCSLL